jgi:hypothetical protein
MDTIDRDTVVTLAGRTGWPLVSIYAPTHRLRIQTEPDRILLRNLVKQACEGLVQGGMRDSEADAMVADVLAFAADDGEWVGGFDGLAIFVDATSTQILRLDTTVPAIAIAGDRFYLRPLFRAYRGSERFWALAIDLNKTRLFKGDSSGIEEVELPKETPVALFDETKFDVANDDQLQYHTVPGATPEGAQGETTAIFHGHGGEKDVSKVQRQQFMSDVDRGVTKTIGAECTDPLVLLGVDYLISDYHQVNSYAHLAQMQVLGATDYLEPKEVQAKVLEALAPQFSAAVQADVDELRALAGTAHTSEDAATILEAAAAGRVKTLFYGDGAGPYGWFDRTNFDVTHLCPMEPAVLREDVTQATGFDTMECGWDLVDLAAAETLLHRGSVHAFTGEDAPVGSVAAVFRY